MNKRVKSIISVVMALVLAIGILAVCPFAADDYDITVKTDRTAYLSGEPVTATVYFPKLYNKIASMDMVLNYDSAKLEVVDVTDGDGLESALRAQTNGRVYSENHKEAGKIKWSLAGTNNFSFTGNFAVITFKIRASASTSKETTTTLSLDVIRAANSGYSAMKVNYGKVTISITKPAPLDLKYELSADKKGYEVVGYTGISADTLVIPDNYVGLPVVGIAKSVFGSHAELKSVTLPNTLQYIGESAFNNCSGLTSIVIPDSVDKIGASAFSGCTSLKSVTLPIGLKTIEKQTFYYCSFLEKVEIPFSVTKINAGAFENCYSLSEVKISRRTTSIASDAFKECFMNIVFKTAEDNTTLPTYIKNNLPTAKIENYKDFSKGTASLSNSKMQYTGKALVPTARVSLTSGAKITRNTDYKVVYKDNIEKGTATVYVAGLGGYGEGYILNFEIYCNHQCTKKTVGLEPSCVVDGYYNCPCDICGEIVKEAIPALGHNEGSWQYEKRPTIYETGLKFTTCTRCDAIIKSGYTVEKVFPDLNGDGYINSSDALIVLQYATGIQDNLKTEKLKLNADTNGDSNINSSDALEILQISIGKIKIDGYTV